MSVLINSIFDKVKQGGYCIGCAACTVVENSPFQIKFQENGTYSAELSNSKASGDLIQQSMSVCPFSGIGKNEKEIGKSLYNDAPANDEYLGFYESNYAGFVNEGEYRKDGSSGGMGTWVLTELFNKGLVDRIIHVKENSEDLLFKFGVSDNIEDIQKSAKSRYYPVEMSEVLKIVKEQPGNYAIIGLPCFIKSIRLLSEKEPIFKERIKFCVGLVCGHLKSSYFAEMMAMQVGFNQEHLKTINFRHKLEGRNAGDYAINVTGFDDSNNLKEVIAPTRDLFGTNWGHGFFKYNACDYCDDVLAETADITIGDAWLPGYIKESKGTNVIVVRNKVINNLIMEAIQQNRLRLDILTADKIVDSQAGGFSHRREGLSYRLHLKQMKNEWYPQKRVEPSNNIKRKRKKIYKGRLDLNKASFVAFKSAKENNDFSEFMYEMQPIVNKYNKVAAPSIIRRILSKGKRLIRG
ncbi:Coenzyme F420 hydrogenase/dehydrogenase, beta subunit C-terminal domain [Sporosarcina sp. A2]|uniref:Coenzyme F420 hydrogenase/dehydrogenase, beta subunit C-terminal domain n=1 Tax=Sporosarcina sp. A2 TaxID=3393449 RepID=UPI003D79346A